MALWGRMLAYCLVTGGSSVLSSCFYFYYVTVFLNHFHIQEHWFHVAQSLFLVWNAFNHPLFAYVQDKRNCVFTRTRRASILFSAPLMALSFVLTWIPWSIGDWVTGLHLVTVHCLYDTVNTFGGLAICSLFTEISSDLDVRLRLTRYSMIGYVIASVSVSVCEYTSDSTRDLWAFQVTAVFLALVALLLMIVGGFFAHTGLDGRTRTSKDKDGGRSETSSLECRDQQNFSFWRVTWQIVYDRNFLSLVSVTFLQEFHRAFLTQCLNIVCDQLLSEEEVPRSARLFFYSSANVFPKILVLVGASVISWFGYKRVVMANFVWKVGAGSLLFLIGPRHPWILMAFLLVDRGFVSADFSLFHLALADIADWMNDKQKYDRPVSSMVFGTSAFIVKPAASLSPMLVVAVLNRYGYEQLKEGSLSPSGVASLEAVMFGMVCLFPIVLGSLQMALWSVFRVRHRQAKEIIM